jgi:hypothetical protein
MAIVQNWLPPSRENWELITWLWQFFPLVSSHLSLSWARISILPGLKFH